MEPEKKIAKPVVAPEQVAAPVEEMTVEECMAWIQSRMHDPPISTEEAIARIQREWGDTPPINPVPNPSSK